MDDLSCLFHKNNNSNCLDTEMMKLVIALALVLMILPAAFFCLPREAQQLQRLLWGEQSRHRVYEHLPVLP